ncbi:MAG: hypothetical protein AB1529_03950 [Candidatus Micrarchaeota archaeon]
MAESFVGIEIAVFVVTASIALAGILWGVGRAFGWKKLELFGVEELMQSIINAAIIGSFAAVIELVGLVSSEVVGESCKEGNVIAQLTCTMQGLNDSLFVMLQELLRTLNLIGYYQGLSLDFGQFAVAPFANLGPVSDSLSLQLLSLNWLMILVELNTQIALFISQNALGLLFPVGLVLRTLFATRKVGGFLIALAIGLYIFYPTFILVFPNPQPDVERAALTMGNFTNNTFYATAPLIDLNDNYAIAAKLDILSMRCNPHAFNITNVTNVTNTTTACDDFLQAQNMTSNVTQNMTFDFTGDITVAVQSNSNAISKTSLYAVVAPIFSLVISIVFVKELANILGSEIGLRTIASI